MIRPFTCVCMLLAAGSGLYLYQAKHQGLLLDRQIDSVIHATAETRTRIGVLRAEFALLNDPSRLQDLVAQHLPRLGPLQPAQFTTLANLDSRLPPVGAPPPAAAPPVEPAPPVVALASPLPAPRGGTPGGTRNPFPTRVTSAAPAATAVSAAPAAPAATAALAAPAAPAASVEPAAPVIHAISQEFAHEPAAAAPAATAPAATAPHPRAMAQRRTRSTTFAARHTAPAPGTLLTSVSTPAWRPTPAPARASVAAAGAAPVGSLLGMARTMGSLSGSAAYIPAAAPGGVSQ